MSKWTASTTKRTMRMMWWKSTKSSLSSNSTIGLTKEIIIKEGGRTSQGSNRIASFGQSFSRRIWRMTLSPSAAIIPSLYRLYHWMRKQSTKIPTSTIQSCILNEKLRKLRPAKMKRRRRPRWKSWRKCKRMSISSKTFKWMRCLRDSAHIKVPLRLTPCLQRWKQESTLRQVSKYLVKQRTWQRKSSEEFRRGKII